MDGREKIRDDFIRRLFAVAISVGFATSLSRMEWIKNGTLPSGNEWQQLAILATGLFATILSWEGYLFSISQKPLSNGFRFGIDVVLVFVYMVLLLTSHAPGFWLPILALIFVLYAVWDFLTILDYPKKYDEDLPQRSPYKFVFAVYGRGFVGHPGTSRGPIITLSWLLYFLGLTAVEITQRTTTQVVCACGFAVVALILYRQDKKSPFGMPLRALLVLVLLAGATLLRWHLN